MQKLPPRPASEVGDRSGLQLERTNLYSPSTLSPEFTQKINFTNIQGGIPGTHLEALRCVIRLVQEYLGELSIFQRKLTRHLSRRILSKVSILLLSMIFSSPRIL